MIIIVWSKSCNKSNTKYYDVVIKWLNVTTLIISIDKTYTLYCDVVIKWLNITNLTTNAYKSNTLYYDIVIKWFIITLLPIIIVTVITIIESLNTLSK